MKRTEAREMLFKVLYETEIQKDFSEEHIDLFIKNNEIEDAETVEYIKKSVNGINEHCEGIEKLISKNLKKDWTLDRISKTSIAILKLAIYEIKYANIPFKVAINEAVDLAKKYSEDAAPAFVNGILASVVAE
ncbi:MAG: transcription antitermination factor NusB [Clostridia bacterium]|nr:transcription antitermination factor NusB [Clostridia bacterium]